MTDDELREQLALLAVGALADPERTEIEDVLRGRPDLQAELAELQDAAAVLADAVPATPPPTLRASILEAIAETPQLSPQTPAAPSEAPRAPVVPITSARRRRILTLGAAAAAVVAVAVAAIVVIPSDDDDDGGQVAAVVEAGDAVEIPMPGALPGVTIAYSAAENAAVILADSVPVLEGEAVYALWAIRAGTPEHFADFRPDEDGRLVVYAAGLDPASADQWAISREPGPDAVQPTEVLNITEA